MISRPIAAVAYYRMSTLMQDKSIEEQRSHVSLMAERHGIVILRDYFDEGISGDDTSERKDFLRMIADAARREFQLILCWDQDRFGRFDSIEAGHWIYLLREARVGLMTVAQGRIDWDNFSGRLY